MVRDPITVAIEDDLARAWIEQPVLIKEVVDPDGGLQWTDIIIAGVSCHLLAREQPPTKVGGVIRVDIEPRATMASAGSRGL